MPTPVLMPALSPTMTDGTLAKWNVKEGDVIKSGNVIAEIETDKATMEVESVDEGVLAAILIPAGTAGVAVNTPIALLAEGAEAKLSKDQLIAAFNAPAPSAPSAPSTAAASPASSTDVTTTKNAAPASSTAVQNAPQQHNGAARIAASPLARRIAVDAGIDLATIKGSGPGGRIVKADVDLAMSTGGRNTAAKSTAAPQSSQQQAARNTAASGMDAKTLADKLGQKYEAVPNSNIRKVIAQRLSESKKTVPHFYLSVDCVLDDLLELRKKLNAVSVAKISVNDFVIRAVALALQKVPAANVSWTDEAILRYTSSDVSVAVATPSGLITPIVKAAETKTLAQIAIAMKDLAVRARDGKLRPEEFQGGGFSVSNLGMYGVREFAAIINPPQACILAVGAGEQRVIAKNGAPAVATVMTVTLSVDHRAVDGAVGAEFLAAFKPLIEDPHSLVV